MYMIHSSCMFVVKAECNLKNCHVMTQRLKILEALK